MEVWNRTEKISNTRGKIITSPSLSLSRPLTQTVDQQPGGQMEQPAAWYTCYRSALNAPLLTLETHSTPSKYIMYAKKNQYKKALHVSCLSRL